MTPERKKVWLRRWMRFVLVFGIAGLFLMILMGNWLSMAFFVVTVFSTGMWFGTQDANAGRPSPRVRQR